MIAHRPGGSRDQCRETAPRDVMLSDVGAFPLGTIADTVRAISDALASFFDSLAQVGFGDLALALALFGSYLVLRALATYNACRAAYPAERILYRHIWGAYVAAFGLNGVVPAGGGSIVQLVLSKRSIPHSRYPAVTVALSVVLVFDTVACIATLIYAFSQPIFPGLGQFVDLNSFDLAFLAGHVALVLFILTATAVLALAAYGWASSRYATFREDLVRGTAILRLRRRYFIGMVLPQSGAYALKVASYWLMLDAFGVGGSLRNALLVLAAQYIASIVPFTPGGLGATQALLVVIFGGAASSGAVAAYSVGQQVALVAFTLLLAFVSIVTIFRYKSFRALLSDARTTHAAERAVELGEEGKEAPAGDGAPASVNDDEALATPESLPAQHHP